jgi:membrane protease YdiL (CAAX protease family)
LPMLVTGRPLAELGLRLGQLRCTIVDLCVATVGLVGLGASGVILLKQLDLEAPLRASGPRQSWIPWVFFQFAYAAFPEELFFRGYLFSNVAWGLRLAPGLSMKQTETIALGLSAAFFALCHALAFRSPAALVTFIPGLIFAWLFARTRSLIGPVLLHGAANVGYVLIAGASA